MRSRRRKEGTKKEENVLHRGRGRTRRNGIYSPVERAHVRDVRADATFAHVRTHASLRAMLMPSQARQDDQETRVVGEHDRWNVCSEDFDPMRDDNVLLCDEQPALSSAKRTTHISPL